MLSMPRHAKCSIYAVQWTHICCAVLATPRHAKCQMPTVFIFSATALLGILAPHTFSTNRTGGERKNSAGPHISSTNSTEGEKKNSAGPLWRGGEGENGCSAIH